ncbi:Spindle pole body component [Teratosphaeria destructans]|uniref:Spindle pole body component n=1 Tax=Teratosphaeria destructans TaxID=418781 RepID=A0A9W7SUP3_9PEZI|nr:Spindle pole body component [Teratosphaeria destructans]
MAHAARLGELAGDLVSGITGRTSQERNFDALKETTLKGFKDQSHPRTNQFAVKQSLDGLVEKFVVRNRDELADALRRCLDELPAESRWLPEILSLLLQLSNRPVENVNIGALTSSVQANEGQAELTWDQILTDDPLEGEGIWDDIDRGYHSSGDEATGHGSESEHTTSTQATTVDDDPEALARSHLQPVDISLLEGTRTSKDLAKQLVKGGEQQSFSDLMAIRGALNMLRGLPASLFDIDEPTSRFELRSNGRFATASSLVSHSLLRSCSDIGSELYALRKWCRNGQEMAHVQSMQAAIQTLLQDYDRTIAKMEQELASPQSAIKLSMIDIFTNIELLTAPLVHLSKNVLATQTALDVLASPFALLDALYNEACIAHGSRDVQLFNAITRAFFAGLDTYLRPVVTWTRTGTLPPIDNEKIFVRYADTSCAPGRVWHDRWTVRLQDSGKSYAPIFMQGFVAQAFASGKAKAFAKILSPDGEDYIKPLPPDENSISFEQVMSRLLNNPLLPFPQVVEEVVHAGIGANGNGDLAVSRQILHQNGFLQMLRAIAYVFFSKDGSLFQSFADSLFRQLQRHGPAQGGNNFLLTELAHATLGLAPGVDPTSISIDLSDNEAADITVGIMSKLASVSLNQALPWPAQNIICSSTLPTHTEVFKLLLQVTYAKSILAPELFTMRGLDFRSKDLAAGLRLTLKLRYSLQWFINILHEHITTTAIKSHDWMCARMENAGDIDSMASIWSAYTTRLLDTMLLAQKLTPIRRAVMEILQECEHFGRLFQSASISRLQRTPKDGDSAETMLGRFGKTVAFIKAGLRGVSRASGETALEALADRLNWEAG